MGMGINGTAQAREIPQTQALARSQHVLGGTTLLVQRYLSNAASCVLCEFRRVKDHHISLHYSYSLTNTCVGQVDTILYYTMLCYAMLYYAILYYTILHYNKWLPLNVGRAAPAPLCRAPTPRR